MFVLFFTMLAREHSAVPSLAEFAGDMARFLLGGVKKLAKN
jgi:hypothetical protein